MNPEAITNLNRSFGRYLLALGAGVSGDWESVIYSLLYWGNSDTGDDSWGPEMDLSGSGLRPLYLWSRG